jgi:hypothetical protein
VRAVVWCGSGDAVVLADRVADAAERLDWRQGPEGEPADLADQREELGDAVASGVGGWDGVGQVAS